MYVCMCICMCVYVYVYVYECTYITQRGEEIALCRVRSKVWYVMHTHMLIHAFPHMFIYSYIHALIYSYTDILTLIYSCIHTSMTNLPYW